MNEEIEDLKEIYNFSCDEKLKYFGYGEWVEEPDCVSFNYLGYECMVFRPIEFDNFIKGGYLCGYVVLPNDYPLYGKNIDELNLECHGGITFSEFNETHFISFDCAHCTDINPSLGIYWKKLVDSKNYNLPEKEFLLSFKPTYKNVNFCINELKSLVNQLIEIKNSVQK
ncbi:MAG: hypothetical protein ABFD00_10425 [Chloroherpetonaceae bacterium]